MSKTAGIKRILRVSEARRLLPELVKTIAEEGGRVDITRRGEPSVSIVNTADLDRSAGERPRVDPLAVEFNVAPDDLVDVVRELRARTGRSRRVGRRPARSR